jgi:putative SOS response-associated peptidase YedK
MYWGFKLPNRFVFNARSDSLLKNGLWKAAFTERRCIILADFFFEWHRIHKRDNPSTKSPYPEESHSAWLGSGVFGEILKTGLPCLLLPSSPQRLIDSMAAIHTRQPAILEPREYEQWLTPTERPPVHLLRVLPSKLPDFSRGISRDSPGSFGS